MIQCENLTFTYQKGKEPVLKNINFSLSPHQITILLGNNGSGKTTLLNCIDESYEIQAGTIQKEKPAVFISDEPLLYEYLTGREYLDVIGRLKEGVSNDLLNQLVEDLKLADDLDKLIINYSLGMKHKLTLISALILGYEVYLIDEPLTALDPDSQRFMIDYFKQLREQGHTFLISTHMMYVAYELADHLLILNQGMIHSVPNDFSTYEAFEHYVLNNLRVTIDY